MDIQRFLTIFHRRREGKKREKGKNTGREGERELIEKERELGNWACHYKHLHFLRRR